MTKLAEGALLQLANALARQIHGAADLLQRHRLIAVETEVEADDAELALNFTFDDGTAMDTSGNDNHGRPQAVTPAEQLQELGYL